VRGCFLDFSKWYAGIEGGGDESMAQGVRPDRLGNPVRWATRRTMQAGSWRSRRLPSGPVKIGPSLRSPTPAMASATATR
jgi:hypothetical protein